MEGYDVFLLLTSKGIRHPIICTKSSLLAFLSLDLKTSNSLLLLQVAFTGNYDEYFGYATDVDAVVYLMLVNDVIHGLFPEAVTIGEDVSYLIKTHHEQT